MKKQLNKLVAAMMVLSLALLVFSAQQDDLLLLSILFSSLAISLTALQVRLSD